MGSGLDCLSGESQSRFKADLLVLMVGWPPWRSQGRRVWRGQDHSAAPGITNLLEGVLLLPPSQRFRDPDSLAWACWASGCLPVSTFIDWVLRIGALSNQSLQQESSGMIVRPFSSSFKWMYDSSRMVAPMFSFSTGGGPFMECLWGWKLLYHHVRSSWWSLRTRLWSQWISIILCWKIYRFIQFDRPPGTTWTLVEYWSSIPYSLGDEHCWIIHLMWHKRAHVHWMSWRSIWTSGVFSWELPTSAYMFVRDAFLEVQTSSFAFLLIKVHCPSKRTSRAAQLSVLWRCPCSPSEAVNALIEEWSNEIWQCWHCESWGHPVLRLKPSQWLILLPTLWSHHHLLWNATNQSNTPFIKLL